MSRNDIGQYLLQCIPNSRLESGGKELVTRCIFCGDSRDPHSKHMYIKVPEDGELCVYHCFKCNESGIVDANLLRMLGIYDIDVINNIVSENKRAARIKRIDLNKEDAIYKISNTNITDNEVTRNKLAYLNKRLGLNLTYQDMIMNKIVLNLSDLLVSNHIDTYTRNIEIVKQLDRNFIGFLSYDNAYLNMRNLYTEKVHPNIDKRYVNYNIFNKMNNSKRYYILPTIINTSISEPIKVHIAEGPMDILSICYNLEKNKREQCIYAAIGGKAYRNIIKFIFTTLGLMNIELHIYPDKDIDNDFIYDTVGELLPFNMNIFVHRNVFPDEKDMGVPLYHIKVMTRQLGRRY